MRPEYNRTGDQEYYRLTQEQVNLIRHMHFDWAPGSEIGYEGGPCINPKRPFGNSNIEGDVWEIVDPRPWDEMHKEDEDEDEEVAWERQEQEQRAAFDRWYRTLGHALQVVLSSGSFEPGIYSCPKYTCSYRRVTDEREIFKAELLLGEKHHDQDEDGFYRY